MYSNFPRLMQWLKLSQNNPYGQGLFSFHKTSIGLHGQQLVQNLYSVILLTCTWLRLHYIILYTNRCTVILPIAFLKRSHHRIRLLWYYYRPNPRGVFGRTRFFPSHVHACIIKNYEAITLPLLTTTSGCIYASTHVVLICKQFCSYFVNHRAFFLKMMENPTL